MPQSTEGRASRPLRILVTRSRQEDVLADTLAEKVRELADFELVTDSVVPAADVVQLLTRTGEAADILIVIGERVDLGTELWSHHPPLVIARIAIASDLVRLDVRRIGLDQLIAALRTLARDAGTAPAERALEYQVVVESSARVGDTYRLMPPAASRPLVTKALAWLDAALLQHHRAKPAGSSEIPGLTRSHATIEHLLASRVDRGESDVAEVERAADAALSELDGAFAAADPAAEPLAALTRGLGLTALETRAVLLLLAPELDAKYQGVFGFLQDDLSRRSATVGLACAVLGDPPSIRAALELSGALVRWRLLDGAGATLPFADEPARLDPGVRTWLLGGAEALFADARLRQSVRSEPWPGAAWLRRPADTSLGQRLARLLNRPSPAGEWITLTGGDADVSRALVESTAAHLARPLLRICLESLAGSDSAEVDETVIRLARAVRLTGSTAVVDATTSVGRPAESRVVAALVRWLVDVGQVSVLIAHDAERVIAALPRHRCHLLHREALDTVARATVLAAAASDAGFQLRAPDAERLATLYPLDLPGIDAAIRLASANGAAARPPEQLLSLVASTFRQVACPDLPRFARRLATPFKLDDVVLPPDRRSQLDEMVAHVTNAATVLERWGFDAQLSYGRGVGALFAGPSGTGKTMAAQAIARELGADAFVVDLARVVSKYIGETEKNLDAVFADAERAGAVLVFDEADALFGKRSEVKDAHDRYANIEVAFLLQRMEAFSGVAILTTNFRQNLDQAFLRRLRFVVEFPRPDATAREAIWRQCLPATAPQSDDIDFRFLARALELNGGNIRQITLRAAFAAAEERAAAIAMRHLLDASRAELQKLGLSIVERELAQHAAALRKVEAAAA